MKEQKNFNSVVVGIDFSKYSKIVVRQAREIAKSLELPLVFVHAFDVPLAGIDDPPMAGRNLNVLLEQLEAHLEKKVQTHYRVSSGETIVVKCGNAFEQIVATAKMHNHPLIIIGYRGGRGAVSRFFLGSTAEKLALHSSFPVWIHRGQKSILPKKILVPCDFSERSSRAIDGLKNLGLNKVKFELYHVRPPVFPILDYHAWKTLNDQIKKANALQLKKFRQKHSQKKIVESDGDVVAEIKKHSRDFDLVAISPREHKGMLASFGSVTSKVVRSGETSVLVIP